MADLVPPENIERIVGAARHPTRHIARAVSAEERVYLLHAEECAEVYDDLRACPFSSALDRGVHVPFVEDRAVVVRIVGGYLKFGSEVA